jgi:hypothetical protein
MVKMVMTPLTVAMATTFSTVAMAMTGTSSIVLAM